MTYLTQVLPTAGGHKITARLYLPQAESQAVVIIASATGVAQRHYEDFARWLSCQGYTAVTFDYDGIGESVDRHVKRSQATMLSWARYDCPAVLDYVAQTFPQQRRIWLGHSVGGHLLGMMDSTDRIDRAITVAAGSGYWLHNSPPTKRVAWLIWYLLVPTVVPVAGYFPGDRLNIMCDLPKGVMMQWRKWCLHPRYVVGVEGEALAQRFASVDIPITALRFSDDEMMSRRSIETLHGFFTGAPKKMVTIEPADIGQKRIGHIGWHKNRYRALWERYILDELAA
ncbi:MAG: alpha/beta hydrolase [Marinobacter sp.]|uniref:alpha/beta hydrolase family protein n=1 Tax=Marinobacter sp. TaxID=50741 RepID=UPI00299EAA37|nr:alpha/beta hydrolase [Marinobacter sp.]MDX1756219.1 alpha/beta hydrolase [Marinobacter sp.]